MNSNCVICDTICRGLRCRTCRRDPQCLDCKRTVNNQMSIRCHECSHKSRLSRRVDKTCKNCFKYLKNKHQNTRYCNVSCRQNKINREKSKHRLNQECLMCFKSLTGSRGFKYCSPDCYGMFRKLYLMNKRTSKILSL